MSDYINIAVGLSPGALLAAPSRGLSEVISSKQQPGARPGSSEGLYLIHAPMGGPPSLVTLKSLSTRSASS